MSDPTAPRGATGPGPGMRVLITGASGFIGGHLAQRLAREGATVRCLARASSDTSTLRELGVELVVGALEDARSLQDAAEGCSHVLHCAALVSDWATKREIAAANVVGTSRLLHACAGAGVQRFLHLSTTDVYGHPGAAEVAETRPPERRFRNWYAQTKLEAELEVRRAQDEGVLEAVILRPATIYGPGSKDVVGEIARAIRARHMPLIGGGRALAGLCYVDNLADAALLALGREAAAGEVFNVSDGLTVTWRRFADDLAAGLHSPPVRFSLPYSLASATGLALEHGYRALRRSTGLTAPPLLSRQAVQVLGIDQSFSSAKAQELLGWSPRVDYASGLAATLDWLRGDYLAS